MITSRESPAIAFGLLALAACAAFPTRPLPSHGRAADGAVYEALLATCCGSRDSTLLVRDSTLGFRAPDSRAVPSFRQRWDSIPHELGPTLDSISRQRRPTRDLSLPGRLVVLRAAELKAIFAAGPDDGWNEFHRRWPAQRRYYGFSPVAYSKNGGEALVYMEYYCGPLCASGDAYWLSRDADGRWRLRQRIQFWVS